MMLKKLWKQIIFEIHESIENFNICKSLLNADLTLTLPNKLNIATNKLNIILLKNNYLKILVSTINKFFEKEMIISFTESNDKHNQIKLINDEQLNVNKPNNLKENLPHFVIHKGNEFTFITGKKFIKQSTPNILFIYGNIGIGKTHLSQLLLLFFKKHKPNKKCKYINSFEFCSEYYNNCHFNSENDELFIKKFLHYDFLVLDDFQYFKNKDNVNHLLIYLLNSFINQGKQIVIVCQKSSNIFNNYLPELNSIIQSGYICMITPPNNKEIEIIVDQFIKKNNPNLSFDKDALEYLCFLLGTDVRIALGKILNILLILDSFSHQKINREILDKILLDMNFFGKYNKLVKTKENSQIEVMCQKLNFNLAEIKSKSRKKQIVNERNIIIWIMKNHLKLTHKKIGLIINRDHSTITNSLYVMDEKFQKQDFSNYINNLVIQLNLNS